MTLDIHSLVFNLIVFAGMKLKNWEWDEETPGVLTQNNTDDRKPVSKFKSQSTVVLRQIDPYFFDINDAFNRRPVYTVVFSVRVDPTDWYKFWKKKE